MAVSVLITQCLQRDFVDPLGAHEPLPNRLHVGREEALRLLGPDPACGPVAQLMSWARAQDEDELHVLHIRDWHDPSDAHQRDHLATFGEHCVRGTKGAELVLGLDAAVPSRSNERTVDSIALNDFEGTTLMSELERIKAKAGGRPLRVGVVGVWTEAKVSFLLYDLKTRCGVEELATCSALTASASRSQHFNALEQLERLLGVKVHDSVGEFTGWLHPSGTEIAPPKVDRGFAPRFELPDGHALTEPDAHILGFLYRDSAKVKLSPLSGGFSGAVVYRVNSQDGLGHEQAPSVAKLGPRGMIGAERAAFERVEAILGNNAPSVRGFVDLSDRAGLKYAYAAMGQGKVRTFKSLYESGAPQEQVDRVLDETFGDILGRLYVAAQYERMPLLDHYRFSASYAAGVRRNVEAIVGKEKASSRTLEFGSERVPNLCAFYEEFLPAHQADQNEFHYVSLVHGDLNGANILIDPRENVWLIDYAHTARGHVLKDLAKMENDLLYIFTKLGTEAELEEALRLTFALRSVKDLAAPLPESVPGVGSPLLVRAWRTVRKLRAIGAGLCREDRNPLQLSIALLRYSAHTLSFDESSPLQKRWALAASSVHAADVADTIRRDRKLRVDWLEDGLLSRSAKGRLGLTLCPGRKDRGRSLEDDVATLAEAGTRRLICLVTDDELDWAGAKELRSVCERHAIAFRHLPILDQSVPSVPDAKELVRWIKDGVERGEDVVVHCMGGLGRTGTIAACALVEAGHPVDAAIAAVRKVRGPRAVEVAAQAEFVKRYAP